MHQYSRRSVLTATAAVMAGCTASNGDEPGEEEEEDDSLEPVFRSAADNADQFITIVNVDEIESAAFVDFWSLAETMEERAEEMGTLCGIYTGVVDERGDDVPPMTAFGIDRGTSEELWAFTMYREWAEEWLADDIDGNEVVQRAADEYEEYVPPGE